MSIMWIFHTNEVVTITSFDLCSAQMVSGQWYFWLSDTGRFIRKTSFFCSYWRALSNLLMLTSFYVIHEAGIEPASYLLQSERPIYHVLCFIRLLIRCLKGENVKQLTIARIHKFLIEYQQFKPWNLKNYLLPICRHTIGAVLHEELQHQKKGSITDMHYNTRTVNSMLNATSCHVVNLICIPTQWIQTLHDI